MSRFAYSLVLASLTACLASNCTYTPSSVQAQTMKPTPPALSLPEKPELSCKLTSPELRQRQATVLVSLKKQIVAKKELADGFAYEFPGTDAMLDELLTFVKTERQCCGFFTFQLIMQEETQTAWLEIKGPEGVKDIIYKELTL